MAKFTIAAGTTSYDINVFVQNSAITTGGGLTGLTSASAGLTAYYHRQGAASAVAITLASKTIGTYAAGGFAEVDATNMPGIYELGVPNTALAAGAKWVNIMLKGASNMAPVVAELELTAFDNQLTTAGLANVSSNVVQWNGTNVSAPATAGIPEVNVKNIANAAVSTTSAQVGVNVVNVGGTAQTAGDIIGDTNDIQSRLPAALTANGNMKASLVEILTTALTETAGLLAGGFKKFFNVSTPTGTLNSIPDAVAGAASGLAIVGSNMGTVSSVTGSVGSVTGAVGSITTGGIAAVSFAAGAINAAAIATDAIDADALAADAVAEMADGVWDEAIAGHLTGGSTGNALNAAGSAGDPWSTDIPGAYAAGSAGHRLGNIPDAVAGAAGGVFIAGSNAATTVNLTGNITGNLSGSVGSLTTNNDKTGYALSSAGIQAIWDALTSALTTVGSIGKLLVDNINATIGSRSSHAAADVWAVATRVLTAGTNIVLAKGSGVTGFNDLDAAGVRTAVGLATANLDTQLGTIAGYVDTEVAAIKAKTDNLPAAPAATGDAMTLTSAYDFAKGTVALTESYNADGAAPTPAQALMVILQMLTEMSISGTTMTIKKLDGTTTALTLTLDDATTPTSVTRAT